MIIIDPSNPTWKLGTLQKGLVLHLPLDEQSFNPATKRFTDKSAYNNHGIGNGTQLGSATPGFQADRMGQANRAAPFNGTDDYISCGNVVSLKPTETVTIEAWVKVNESKIQFIGGTGNTATQGYFIHWEAGRYTFNLGNGTVRAQAIGPSHPLLVRIHTVGTYDGANIRMYTNGVLRDTVGITGAIDYTGIYNTYIGQMSSLHPDRYLNGSIAEVRIYNRALSQQEITLLYESYRPKMIL